MPRQVGQRLSAPANDPFQGHMRPRLPWMDGERVIEAPVARDTLTKRYTEHAITFITRNRDWPFF